MIRLISIIESDIQKRLHRNTMDPFGHHPPRDPVLSTMRLVFLFSVVILAALVAWRFLSPGPSPVHDPAAEPLPVTPRSDLGGDEKAFINLFEHVSPSVVFITNLAVRRDRITLNIMEIPQGSGSGFIWSKNGHIVTNFHVIRDADQAHITLADHTTWRARLVGIEPGKDLAVLKIEAPAEQLKPITIGTSRNLKVGQRVFAIGNPFGLDQSMSLGIISGLNREIRAVNRALIQGVIQTDAAINPGNSGGPLLDSAGRLIGVNTMIYSPSGAHAGVGFAVPVDTVNRIVPDLIRDGRVTRAGFGISITEGNFKGVRITQVQQGSAAERAGMLGPHRSRDGYLVMGDIITAVNEKPVEDSDDLFKILEQFKVRDTVTVTVLRNNQEKRLTVTLQALY